MSPRSTEQYEEIRQGRKQEIFDAALELFAEEGFHGTPISKIAKKAGISKGLMYNYFVSKEQLLKELIHSTVRNTWKNFDPDNDGILTDEEFVFFIRESISMVKGNVTFWRLYSALVLQPKVLKIIEHDFDNYNKKIMLTIIQFFKERGSSDPEGELMFLSATIKGAIMQYIAAPEWFPIEKIEQMIINMYVEKYNIKVS